MALTLLDLVDNVTLVLGEEADPRINTTQIVNSAGRMLFNAHSWRWRERPVATLGTTADQGYTTLPSDFGFGEVIDLSMTDAIAWAKPQATTLGEIEWMRQQSSTPAVNFYWYALAYPTQASTSAAPGQPRLELFDIPATTDADVFKLTYRAGWVELSSMTAVANVPVTMESLLVRLVQAYAAQRDPRTRADQAFEKPEQVLESLEMQHAKRADGAAQSDLGPIGGGLLSANRGGNHLMNFDATGP